VTKDPGFYADHILEAIQNIEADIAGHDFEAFRENRRVRQLVERNLEILSEASRRLPEEAKHSEPSIPWPAIAAIGNLLRHDYHRSQPSILWETCQRDLPDLKAAVQRIRAALGDG
jgi:uncharacterized protein with HEPN domain